MTDTPDTKDTRTMTRRGVHAPRQLLDPQKWAEAFVRWTAGEMPEHEILERATYVTPWFRDYAEVKVAEALRGETDSACPPTS